MSEPAYEPTAADMHDWAELGRIFPDGSQVLSHASWTHRKGGTIEDCPYDPQKNAAEREAHERWTWMFRLGERAKDQAAWDAEKQRQERQGLR